MKNIELLLWPKLIKKSPRCGWSYDLIGFYFCSNVFLNTLTLVNIVCVFTG